MTLGQFVIAYAIGYSLGLLHGSGRLLIDLVREGVRALRRRVSKSEER